MRIFFPLFHTSHHTAYYVLLLTDWLTCELHLWGLVEKRSKNTTNNFLSSFTPNHRQNHFSFYIPIQAKQNKMPEQKHISHHSRFLLSTIKNCSARPGKQQSNVRNKTKKSKRHAAKEWNSYGGPSLPLSVKREEKSTSGNRAQCSAAIGVSN